MSWKFWSDFLNSKDDYYPIKNDVKEEVEKFEREHPETANLIERIMDDSKLVEKIKEE